MRRLIFFALFFIFIGGIELQAQNKNEKILVVYYSRTGNTNTVAEYIHKAVGGDIFQIKTVNPYPDKYQAATEVAKQEKETNSRPKLASNVNNMNQYDVIFIGYPIWWGTMPMVFFTFLESHNLKGKTIIPFCTHGGSGLGQSIADIKKLCPKSTVLEGLPIRGTDTNDINPWLRRIGILK